jgi:predicted SAM-dependent methyltransferase
MPGSAAFGARIHIASRRIAAALFAVPLLGYGLRIVVGILKLPRLNLHLRRVDAEVQEVLRRLYTELEAMRAATVDRAAFEAQTTPLIARVAALEVAWRQNVPAFLNAVGTVPAFSHELTDLRQHLERAIARLEQAEASARAIWERVDSLGRDARPQAARGNGAVPEDGTPRATVSRILTPEKIAAARKNGAFRLNLGYGHTMLPDYVNVDLRDMPGVDVVAEATRLPFEAGSIDEIFSAHLVEQFPQETMEHRLLPYWHSLLRPGGTLRVVASDAAAMIAGTREGTYAFDDFRDMIFGSRNGAGDHRHNLFTADSLRRMLHQAGFADIEVPVTGRRNGQCLEFEICARRI